MSKKPSRFRLNPTQMAIVGVIVAVGLFLFGYTNRLINARELQAEVQTWQNEVRVAQEQVDKNRALLEYVKTDQYVVQKGHTDLGWAFPNEVAVWVIGRDEDPMVAELPASSQTTPYWQQWQQRFFGK